MILLTRPYNDSLALAQTLGAQNCVIAPMLEIETLKFKIPKSTQATICTSKNVHHNVDIKIPEHGKNAAEILQYCLNNLSPAAGKIIYLSGNVVSLDIAEHLRQHGFDAQRVIAYNQILTKKLLADLHIIAIATFFSEQALLNFKALSNDNELAHITCICISEKVASTARKMGWKRIVIAQAPNLRNMIAATQQASLDT